MAEADQFALHAPVSSDGILGCHADDELLDRRDGGWTSGLYRTRCGSDDARTGSVEGCPRAAMWSGWRQGRRDATQPQRARSVNRPPLEEPGREAPDP
jgi:hypothetical protein